MNAIGVLNFKAKPIGTAFLVTPEKVLTCYHVVANATNDNFAGESFKLQFIESKIEVEVIGTRQFNQVHDAALLRVSGSLSRAIQIPLLINAPADALAGAPFNTQGYGIIDDRQHTFQYKSAHGTINGLDGRDGQAVIHIESQAILRGMSGAPVLALGGVVGMITARYAVDPTKDTRNRDSAWAIRAEDLAGLDPQLQLHPIRRSTPDGGIVNYGTMATGNSTIIQVSGGTYVGGDLTTHSSGANEK